MREYDADLPVPVGLAADFNFRAKVSDFGLSRYKRPAVLPAGYSRSRVSHSFLL